ncbi:MAG TPA: TolC family protein [Fibrobacteria bacterium]|nr:TolC family protein [Fibrobacteria bacterium]
MRFVLPAALALVATSVAQEFKLSDVVRRTLQNQPQLAEDSMDLDRSRHQIDLLRRKVILPKFEVEAGFGPAPGFRYEVTPLANGGRDSSRRYEWWPLGPAFQMEVNVQQPLNVGRLRAGMRAARAGVRVASAELDARRASVVKDALTYLFGFQYATRMRRMLDEAATKIDSVESSLQEKLDNDDEDASQTDLFQIRIGRYELDKSLQEAKLGQDRARQGLAFSLGLSSPDSLRLVDSLLQPLPELPAIDSMILGMSHPDLRRLAAGLEAKKALVDVQRASLGPDLGVVAQFQYRKAWVANRDRQNKDVLITDPINNVGGALGIGAVWHLNFWSQLGEVRKAELEWLQLRRKEVYARKGLETLLRDAWLRYRTLGERQAAAQKGKDAAEAWLKSVAIQVDLDPSLGKELIGPYKTLLDFQNKYWDAVHERNKAALDVLQAMGALLESPVLGGPYRD